MEIKILSSRYEIQQQLGKKTGRRTLLSRDLVTHELVVIKLLSFSSDFEWDDLKLFEREAQTLKSLSHPAIPRYLDYFAVNLPTIKGFALVQSYIPAQTLEQYLQTGRTFTEAEITQIAKAVLEILIYLHGLHPPVIHRDIKPSNILLGERSGNSVGEVYLVDFGSVQTVLATEGSTRTLVGTYGYMPLEQFGGRTVAASDIYSLGATLIYLATGIQPADLPQKDFRIQFEPAANLSPGLTGWLRLMTEPSLERRLSCANAALNALLEPQLQNISSLTVGKPANSIIQLTKNQEVLEIIIDYHLSWSSVYPILFSSAMITLPIVLLQSVWHSFVIWLTISYLSTSFPFNLFSLTVLLPFWYVSYSWLYPYLMLLRLFVGLRVRLRIDSQKITFTHELLGLKFHRPRPSLRKSISKLVYIPEHLIQVKGFKNQTEVPAQLNIWAGTKKYQLSIYTSTEPEREWLAGELSEFLDIPIQEY